MKRNQGFTLLEVQISAMVMIVVLIATGVIFYFALASIRYMHDAFMVYTNATTAMNFITEEVMRSNCYGSVRFPPAATPPDSFYGVNGYVQPGGSGISADTAYPDMPTLNDSNAMVVSGVNWGTGLYLRQATQASFIRGEVSDVAGDFPTHEIVQIYRVWDNDPAWTRIRLMVDRDDPLGGSTTQAIADNVVQFDYRPIAYNAIHVVLTVQGSVQDPIGGGPVHSLTLSKQITLRCAPSVSPIGGAVSW